MEYRVIDMLNENGEQDKTVKGELIGRTESLWQAARICDEYETEKNASNIPVDVRIYDENDQIVHY